MGSIPVTIFAVFQNTIDGQSDYLGAEATLEDARRHVLDYYRCEERLRLHRRGAKRVWDYGPYYTIREDVVKFSREALTTLTG
jgi:hypothetical protein